ncbi:endopeptidase La [Nitratiruptor tergarcus]|uniref:Lon protease n=1 Tax=Nitratiruptor tergarcus DSM 16512 TaxID=1069081 RepID=A0A1W1WUV2_9BACT|nr:endopeptidase La [Nitratiruptor tergarcus]SMC10098.1 ATP-dependent Lon protease [Nitratiruptor tergarcus DSM 16512]
MQLSDYSAFPTTLPIVVEDDMFLYPFMISPIFISDEANIAAAETALRDNSLILVCPSKEGHEGERSFDVIYPAGVIGSIMRKVNLPDGRVKLLFQGLARGKILEQVSNAPLRAVVDVIESKPYNEIKIDALLEVLREKIRTLASISSSFPQDLVRTVEENHEPNRIADLVSSVLKLKKSRAYEMFIEEDVEKRLMLLIDVVSEEIEQSKLQREIKSKVSSKLEQANREYFLKEQLKQIQKELGVDTQREEEIEEYRKKLENLKPHLTEEAYKEIKKQIDRYARMHPDSAEAVVIQTYLDWVLEVPFGKYSKKKLDIQEVKERLDKDHYGLEKPKERIVEYFAVKELMELRGVKREKGSGAILCFAGPPGIGKTSLANSIATALKRPLVRIALGGLEDVNELRGHRRTYIGAMPGRIVQGLIEAKEMDPVMVLDEIDKVGRSMRGDPTSVLLEILDPEQNTHFRDYYLNFSIDLSNVIFIATANDIGYIPAPLRDRMEFIFLSSYTPNEKYEIAKRYLIPQELRKHGLKKSELTISKSALEAIIEKYTREAGVRNLRRRIADIVRKAAKELLENPEIKKISITLKNLSKYLEKPVFEIEEAEKHPQVGVVNGLAWTAVGGDVLKIESIKIKGKGSLQLTGRLGEVMRESASIAFSVVKVLIDSGKIKIDQSAIPKTFKEKEEKIKVDPSEVYRRYDILLHIPEGATPKDGPSAGITMATSIASLLSERKVRPDVAMTGELTLTGKVLPIGGLKEKLIAAYKAKIKKVLIPKKNYDRDLDEIPAEVVENLNIVPVTTIEEVLKEALL